MTELKPCPFCGAPAKLWQTNWHFFVECSQLNRNIPDRHIVQVSADTRAKAIRKWNRRAKDGGGA